MWLLKLFIVICVFKEFKSDEEIEDVTRTPESIFEDIIKVIERTSMTAYKYSREGIVPMEDTEKLYRKITLSLEDLTDQITVDNAFVFFGLNGVDRVILPNMRTTHLFVRAQLLHFIKTLFVTASMTTNAVLPHNIVDLLLEIFENDPNLAIKSFALDILYLWLPNNPKLQSRVMKLKGLEPFYNQISKLDSEVVFKLLDLFNIILEEHVTERKKNQRNQQDYENFKMYQMIGLIERMSTATVCEGLLNVFKAAVTLSENAEEVLVPVLKLMKNIKPYCMKLYKAKNSAVNVFLDIQDYLKDKKNIDFEAKGLNSTEINLILTDYTNQLHKPYNKEL